jgi:hypothetical protein
MRHFDRTTVGSIHDRPKENYLVAEEIRRIPFALDPLFDLVRRLVVLRRPRSQKKLGARTL